MIPVFELTELTHDADDAEGLDHIVCCNEDLSLCGLDVSRDPWCYCNAEARQCVVCVDLADADIPCSPACRG